MATEALRALRTLGLVWIASIAVFAITRLMPTTPMEAYLTQMALPVTPENVANLRHQWGLDENLWAQYWHWISGMLRGEWGHSIFTDVSIGHQFAQKVPISLTIGLGGVALATLLAYPLGVLAGLRGGVWDATTRALAVGSQAVPSFVIAVLLIQLLGVTWHLVPFYALRGPAALVAPTLLIAIYNLGQLSRLVAQHVRETIPSPWVRSARGRGLPLSTLVWSDDARAIAYTLCSNVVAKMAWVIGGTAIVEFVFAVPGVSNYLISSIQMRDYAVIQAYLMVLVLWMAGVHLVCDALMAWLDPRRRAA